MKISLLKLGEYQQRLDIYLNFFKFEFYIIIAHIKKKNWLLRMIFFYDAEWLE